MIKFLSELIDYFLSDFIFKFPSSLRIAWKVVFLCFIVIFLISLVILLFENLNKLLNIIKLNYSMLDFNRYYKTAFDLYAEYIPLLNHILKKHLINRNIGGLVALVQTNWQFKKKNNKRYIIREPELLGFREILEVGTLVQLAIKGVLEIENITLKTEDASQNKYHVLISLINPQDSDVKCRIPKGQIFENKKINSITQNLVTYEEYEIKIRPKSCQPFRIPALCLNRTLKPPAGQDANISIFEVMNKNYNNQEELWSVIEYINKKYETEGIYNGYKPDIARAIINAAAILQGNSKSIDSKENSRTSYIASILSVKGFKVKDQTLWGSSESGKSAGEVDIKIEDEEGNATSICEAMVLKTKSAKIINIHLKKIFEYDPNGIGRNFILVYSEAKEFAKLWESYLAYVNSINYKYPLNNGIVDISSKMSPYTDIKVALGYHNRNLGLNELYHIFINLI